jgi:hypothetical protein
MLGDKSFVCEYVCIYASAPVNVRAFMRAWVWMCVLLCERECECACFYASAPVNVRAFMRAWVWMCVLLCERECECAWVCRRKGTEIILRVQTWWLQPVIVFAANTKYCHVYQRPKVGFRLVTGFTNDLQVANITNYYIIADLHNLQSLHANLVSLLLIVFTVRFLATDL